MFYKGLPSLRRVAAAPVSLIRELSRLLYTDDWSGSRPSEDILLVGGLDAAVEQLPNIHWRPVDAVGKGKLHSTCAFEGTLLRKPVLFET